MPDPERGEWKPLLRSDGDKFLGIAVEIDDWRARLDAYLAHHATGPDILLGEVLRYGILANEKMISDLRSFYDYMLEKGMRVDMRRHVFSELKSFVEAVKFVTANAYLPFISREPDRWIVASAVIEYVSRAPLTDNDPMSRVKDVIGFIENDATANRGATFGGLLYLGDPRVTRLLWEKRHLLSTDEVHEATGCQTPIIAEASVYFLLDWLESLEGELSDGLFGSLASGLVLLRRSSAISQVRLGQRLIPSLRENGDVASADCYDYMPIDQFSRQIAPRLYALERTEPEPRVIPEVLVEWGLQRSKPS